MYKRVCFLNPYIIPTINYTKGTELCSFCHIFSHYDKHIVASKPNGHGKNYWVLKIGNTKVVRED